MPLQLNWRRYTAVSGADLRRLVDDGKLLFAYDRARGRPMAPATEYFARAIETFRANEERYAEAEAQARTKPAAGPSFFDTGDAFAFSEMAALGGQYMTMNMVATDEQIGAES